MVMSSAGSSEWVENRVCGLFLLHGKKVLHPSEVGGGSFRWLILLFSCIQTLIKYLLQLSIITRGAWMNTQKGSGPSVTFSSSQVPQWGV